MSWIEIWMIRQSNEFTIPWSVQHFEAIQLKSQWTVSVIRVRFGCWSMIFPCLAPFGSQWSRTIHWWWLRWRVPERERGNNWVRVVQCIHRFIVGQFNNIHVNAFISMLSPWVKCQRMTGILLGKWMTKKDKINPSNSHCASTAVFPCVINQTTTWQLCVFA